MAGPGSCRKHLSRGDGSVPYRMRRRALLASVASSSIALSSGCLDRIRGNGGDDGCGDVELFGTVTIRDMPDAGTGMHVRATARSEECEGSLTLETVSDGQIYTSIEEESTTGQWEFDVRTDGQLPDGDTVTLRCIDENGVEVGSTEEEIARQ